VKPWWGAKKLREAVRPRDFANSHTP
jgi:hypothetical protein